MGIVGEFIGLEWSGSSSEAIHRKYHLGCFELILRTVGNLRGALSRDVTMIIFVFRNHSDSSVECRKEGNEMVRVFVVIRDSILR